MNRYLIETPHTAEECLDLIKVLNWQLPGPLPSAYQSAACLGCSKYDRPSCGTPAVQLLATRKINSSLRLLVINRHYTNYADLASLFRVNPFVG